jgi:hypothetical protein
MSDFSKIKDVELQAYNRMMYAKGLKEDVGPNGALNYLDKFSKKEKLEMAKVMAKIEKVGMPTFKRNLTKSLGIV